MRQGLLALIAILGTLAYGLTFGFDVASPPRAQAASTAAPTTISDNCELVATVGLLETYLCELPDGDVYINSFGFMLAVE